MALYHVKGFNDDEYARLLQEIKQLSFPVRVRRHTQQYAYHAVDIRATQKTNYVLTDQQITELMDWCATRGYDDHLGVIRHRERWDLSCFRQGLTYLAHYQVQRETPGDETCRGER